VDIRSAYVQFTADEKGRAGTSVTLRAEAADNAAPFTTSAFNLSTRPRTSASVNWSVPAWTVFGAAGADQRTPDLSSVLQEVVNRAGWASGNAVVLTAAGSGRRTAESFEGGAAPVLHVTYGLR
jgi:hypothetical protein